MNIKKMPEIMMAVGILIGELAILSIPIHMGSYTLFFVTLGNVIFVDGLIIDGYLDCRR